MPLPAICFSFRSSWDRRLRLTSAATSQRLRNKLRHVTSRAVKHRGLRPTSARFMRLSSDGGALLYANPSSVDAFAVGRRLSLASGSRLNCDRLTNVLRNRMPIGCRARAFDGTTWILLVGRSALQHFLLAVSLYERNKRIKTVAQITPIPASLGHIIEVFLKNFEKRFATKKLRQCPISLTVDKQEPKRMKIGLDSQIEVSHRLDCFHTWMKTCSRDCYKQHIDSSFSRRCMSSFQRSTLTVAIIR